LKKTDVGIGFQQFDGHRIYATPDLLANPGPINTTMIKIYSWNNFQSSEFYIKNTKHLSGKECMPERINEICYEYLTTPENNLDYKTDLLLMERAKSGEWSVIGVPKVVRFDKSKTFVRFTLVDNYLAWISKVMSQSSSSKFKWCV